MAEWQARWKARRAALYRELIESYTPEQKALAHEMDRAASEAVRCGYHLRYPHTKRALPHEPPNE